MVYWFEDTSQKSLKIPGIEVFDFKSQVYCATKKIYLWRSLQFKQHNRDDVKYTTNQEIHGVNTRYNINLHLLMANLTALQKGSYFFFLK